MMSNAQKQELRTRETYRFWISPGAVDTELPNTISEPDIATNMQQFYKDYAIPADSFAKAVAFAISQPEEIDINEILYRPTRQVY